MNGKQLWIRTIASTIVGEAIDTTLFITLAFAGVMPASIITSLIISSYLVKVGIEIIFTPVTYAVVNLLKRRENEDYYDRDTNFNPFLVGHKTNV